MIIDQAIVVEGYAPSFFKGMSVAIMLAIVWIAVAAVAMLPGSISAAFVLAGTSLPQSVSVVGRRGPFLLIQSDDPAYVRQLYMAGAIFVFPARKRTCLNLSL